MDLNRQEAGPHHGTGLLDNSDRDDAGPDLSRAVRLPVIVPVVRALVSAPPSYRAQHTTHVVPCPFCPGGRHVHRGAADGGVRRAGCGRGRYEIVPALEGRWSA